MWNFIIVSYMLRLVVSSYLLSDGDVTVGGLFEIYSPEDDGSCSGITGKVQISSVMFAEAVKWYFDQLHAKGGLSFKIGKMII